MLYFSTSFLSLIITLFLMLGCSRREPVHATIVDDEITVKNISNTEDNQNPSMPEVEEDFGHIVIQVAEKDQSRVSVRSLQQPDAQMRVLDKTKIALLNLLPQKHTFIATMQAWDGEHHAVFNDVPIEAGTYLELGEPPFQKSGTLKGRLLSAIDSSPLKDLRIGLKSIGAQARTDSNGSFVLPNIPAGKWSIFADANELGHLKQQEVEVKSDVESDVGDLWIGPFDLTTSAPQLLNGLGGVLSELEAKVKLHLPTGARFVEVRTEAGEIVLPPIVSRQVLTIPLLKANRTELNIFVYDSRMKLLGIQTLPLHFDPFSSGGVPFIPQVKISQRVIVSPQLTFSIELLNTPAQAQLVRFGIDGKFGSWRSPENTMSLTLPRSNLMCGQRIVDIQYRGKFGEISTKSSIPVTVSCWERIAHRAALEDIIGLDNAAVWTGTHAFVWSGRQFDMRNNRATIWGGSNSAETVDFQNKIQKYIYSDAGYIFQPKLNTVTNSLTRSQMEFIVTDNAPAPRVLAGTGGHNNFVAVYGGENDAGPLADGAIFDINANGWVSMMGEGAPSPRIKPSVIFIDENRILVWGGKTRTNLGYDLALNDGAIYNRLTHQWTKVSDENAPRARVNYVGVWTGSKFFVVGGRVPGGLSAEEYTSGVYAADTNTWTALGPVSLPSNPAVKLPFSNMSALYMDDHILFFGRNNSFYNISVAGGALQFKDGFTLSIGDWKLNPTMVVSDDLADPSKKLLYIFGGTASEIATNITNSHVLLLDITKTIDASGVINLDVGYRGQTSGDDVFFSATVATNDLDIGTCCADMLGFNFAGWVFALNGTEVSHSTVYTDVSLSTNAAGAVDSYVNTVNAVKSRASRAFRLNADNSFSKLSIDVTERNNNTGTAVVGPYNYDDSNDPPVWDKQNKNLIWYGGMYWDPHELTYVDGGLYYNLVLRQWSSIPVAPSEPSFTMLNGETYYYSRFNAFSFYSGNAFYQLGGYNYSEPSVGGFTPVVHLFNGLKSSFTSGSFSTPLPILTTAAEQEFDFTSTNAGMGNKRWVSQPPCVGASEVLLLGGWRKTARGLAGIDDTKALVQHKVIFDTATNSLRRAPDGPLGVRAGSTILSTGSDCIVWGGYSADEAVFDDDFEEKVGSLMQNFAPHDDGALYSFDSENWRTMSAMNAPRARAFMHGVWTGKEALLWGGSALYSPSVSSPVEAGKGVWLYSPSEDFWRYLPSAPDEPKYNGYERPVWTGRHMFIWKSESVEHNYLFTPEKNVWSKMNLPYGFLLRQSTSGDAHVVWTDTKLFIGTSWSTMAFFVPPDP